MFRIFTAVLVVAALSAVVAPEAQAIFITSEGTVEVRAPQTGGSPPILEIRRLDGSGFSFTNQIGGVPFGFGAEIRTISVGTLTTAINGTQVPISVDRGDGTFVNLIAITAIQGMITSATGSAVVTASFTAGRAFLTYEDSTLLQAPSTWNFDEAFSEWELKPAERVTTGRDPVTGNPVGSVREVDASKVNVSSVNTAVGASPTDGAFLFREDSPVTTDPSDPSFTATNSGDNFIRDVQDGLLGYEDLPKKDEGLFIEVNQVLEQLTFAQISGDGGGWTIADFDALNAIAAAAGFSDLDPGTAGDQSFASGMPGIAVGSGVAVVGSDYNPFPGGVPNGDFRAELEGFSAHIGYQPIPEPSSIVLFSLLFGAMGFARSRARRRNQGAGLAA